MKELADCRVLIVDDVKSNVDILDMAAEQLMRRRIGEDDPAFPDKEEGLVDRADQLGRLREQTRRLFRRRGRRGALAGPTQQQAGGNAGEPCDQRSLHRCTGPLVSAIYRSWLPSVSRRGGQGGRRLGLGGSGK